MASNLWKLSTVVLAAGCLFLAGCKSDSDSSKVPTSIAFSGSSTLAPVISKLGANYHNEFKTWNKADSNLPDSDVTIYVSSGGSGTGIKAVMDKTADFGLVARDVKDSEKAKIKDYKEYKVGIDALGIAVNQDNPLYKVKHDLTKDEIKKIFSGEFKTWQQVDASLPADEIVVVTRDIGGGAHEVFQQKIMGDTKVTDSAIQAPSMGALVAKIKENKNAIGYASYGVMEQNKGQLNAFSIEGVSLDENHILDGSYIIQRPLLIIGSGDLTPLQKVFIDYIMSDAGKKVIAQMGFIPVK